jgi:hypothetical protein
MHRRTIAALSAATFVAALGLTGCGTDSRPGPPPTATQTVATFGPRAPSATQAPPLPPPSALTDVLDRLADPSVAGADKLGVVQYATAGDATALDNFGRALKDGGYTPLKIEATDLIWSNAHPGNVVASVTIGAANQNESTFTFPMEFDPIRNTWQLTRQTADRLLQLGQPQTSTAAPR